MTGETTSNPFPTQPLEGESNEAFAERKREWTRDNSERIRYQKWTDSALTPEGVEYDKMTELGMTKDVDTGAQEGSGRQDI